MTTLYTNNPSRFGGCFATHDPTASQAPVTPPVTTTAVTQQVSGVRGKNRINLADENARNRASEFIKAQIALDEKRDEEVVKPKARMAYRAGLAKVDLEAKLTEENNEIISLILLNSL